LAQIHQRAKEKKETSITEKKTTDRRNARLLNPTKLLKEGRDGLGLRPEDIRLERIVVRGGGGNKKRSRGEERKSILNAKNSKALKRRREEHARRVLWRGG